MKPSPFSFILFFIVGSLVLLQSCDLFEKEEPHDCEGLNRPPEYYKLSEGQKAILPYTGYDTISMVSNMGDTIHCIGTGKQYFNTMEFKESGIALCASYGTELYYEAYKIEFIDSAKNKKIELNQYYKYLFNKTEWDLYVFEVIFNDWGGGFFVNDRHISAKDAYNYVGDISINNILYSKTNKVSRHKDDYYIPIDTLSYMLINRTNGILKLQLNNTETWELLPN